MLAEKHKHGLWFSASSGSVAGVTERPAGEAWRLFVALELPDEVGAMLADWRDHALATGFAGLRPVGRDQLHVTLCFLGLVQADSVAAIGRACSTIGATGRPLLRIGEALWLPRRRPGVLAVSVDDIDGRLVEAQSALARALTQIGAYRPEARAFLPHVTVARVGRGAKVRSRELEQPSAVGFEGERVTLYRSVLGRGGARYESLHTVAL